MLGKAFTLPHQQTVVVTAQADAMRVSKTKFRWDVPTQPIDMVPTGCGDYPDLLLVCNLIPASWCCSA